MTYTVAMRLCMSLPMVGFFAWLLIGGGAMVSTAQGQSGERLHPATRSAIYLMQRSVQVRRDGTHNPLLRSLRHLQDPQLEPLFAALADAGHPALQIHGNLGLAEVWPERQIDLRRVAEIDDAPVQAELLSAAMDSDLLDIDAAAQLLNWPGLDTGVRLLTAAKLLASDKLHDRAILDEGLASDRLVRRGLAGLMLHQLGDQRGSDALHAIDQHPDTRQRDIVRAMLLNTALRHTFDRSATWAYAIAIDPTAERRLVLLALQTALHFGDPRAATQWQQQFDSTRDAAQRVRLALTALQAAPQLQPSVFRRLVDTDDELLTQVGRVGLAMTDNALGRESDAPIGDAIGRLIALQHMHANKWALRYAAEDARPADARRILLAIIGAYEQAPERQRIRRLDEAVQAAQALYELDPAGAAERLRPMLLDDGTDRQLVQAILLGLVRTQQGQPWRVIDGIDHWPDTDAAQLALLLRAQHDQPLSEAQMRDLAVLVQGGGNMQDSLRIQAAWCWLKRTDKTGRALRSVLESMRATDE